MYKKLIMIVLMLFSMMYLNNSVCFAEGISFSDLPEDHWAYKAVSKLVNEGTIKGNENGDFEPDKMVLREEFVKMIGKGPSLRGSDFADVPTTHWGYEYIMSSGLNGDENNNFSPSLPMTRGQTIELLWTRAGKPTGIIAPRIITSQAQNKEAVAWIYTYGIMVGSDGVNLRVEDPISRAEAAALIIRAREITPDSKQISFIDAVSPALLENIYRSIPIFELPYDPNRTLTNGEMARAAVRLASGEYNLTYRNFYEQASFEDPFAKDLAIIGKCIGKDKVNESFIKLQANNIDTLSAFSYAAILQANSPISNGNANHYYKDIGAMDKSLYNTMLTFAYENGIMLYAKGELKPNEQVTIKNIAAILLQLDSQIGLQCNITTDRAANGKNIGFDGKLEKDLSKYPINRNDFACILQDMPQEVYTTGFEKVQKTDAGYNQKPTDTYNFAREYSSMFLALLNRYKDDLKQKYGMEARFTFFPSLAHDNQSGFTVRVKCEIISLGGKTYSYKEVFTSGDVVDDGKALYEGMTFYADLATDYLTGAVEKSELHLSSIKYLER